MNTKHTGNTSVGAVMSKLLKSGRVVLLPVGDNERYDLVIEEEGKFTRIQVKTGRVVSGALMFNASSTNLEKGKWVRHTYQGQADCFGVYCPEIDKVYIIPVENNKQTVSLRLEPTKNKQSKLTRWAKDYEIGPITQLVE